MINNVNTFSESNKITFKQFLDKIKKSIIFGYRYKIPVSRNQSNQKLCSHSKNFLCNHFWIQEFYSCIQKSIQNLEVSDIITDLQKLIQFLEVRDAIPDLQKLIQLLGYMMKSQTSKNHILLFRI